MRFILGPVQSLRYYHAISPSSRILRHNRICFLLGRKGAKTAVIGSRLGLVVWGFQRHVLVQGK